VYVATLREALLRDVRVTIVTAGRGPMTDIALVNLRHRWYPLYAMEVPLNVLRILWLVMIGRIPRKAAVFDIHGAANIAPVIVARLLRMPTVWHLHETVGAFRPFVRFGVRLLTKNRHRVVVVAVKVAETFAVRSVQLARPPVDLSWWQCRDGGIPAAAGAGELLRIVCVGNFNPLKGQNLLLEALSKFPHSYHLTLAGASLANHRKYYARIQTRAKELSCGNANSVIALRPWLENDEVRALMCECDVVVLPSRSEACPLVLLQAMALGCVCIATDVGGVAEILKSEREGFMVPPGRPEALREALDRVRLLRRAERTAIAKAAQARINDECEAGAVAKFHLAMYRELLGESELEDQ